jgi:hypothetical protein
MLVSNNAREALRHAQGNLAAAEAALQAARATTSRARAMLEEIVREGERLEADGRRAADALADKIRGAIDCGAGAGRLHCRPIASPPARRAGRYVLACGRRLVAFDRARRTDAGALTTPAVACFLHPRPAPNKPFRIAFSSSSTRIRPIAASDATPISGQSIGRVS